MDATALRADVAAKPAALTALSQALDDGLLGRCGPFLERRFRRYHLIGMGASYLAAAQVAARMRSLGLDAAADLASSRYGYPMDVDTLTVAVSASGATTEVLDAVDRLDGHFPVLALTDAAHSPLGGLAGAVLPLLAGPGSRTCRTFLHTGLLLHALTVAWTGGLPRMVARDVAVLAERVAASTSDLLARRESWLPGAAASLDGGGALCAVAPAERVVSAHWSAHLLRTVPRRPADSSESADWLHSHAHLTNARSGLDYRALVITGSRSDREVLERLTSRGAGVVTIGAGSGHVAGSSRAGMQTVRFPDDDDHDVALHTAATVGELIAATL